MNFQTARNIAGKIRKRVWKALVQKLNKNKNIEIIIVLFQPMAVTDGLRRGSLALVCWDCEVESRWCIDACLL